MPTYRRKVLAVVGAGPKGIAVAVKAKVLEEIGLPVDRVILIEKHGVAAHWSGNFGYTNGEMKLGTSPEKDVVFPLETELGDKSLNARVRDRLLQFTWAAFLIQTQSYSDWVDRGRPAPTHQQWAMYLQWVSFQLAPQVQIIKAEVVGVDLSADGKQWEISLKGDTTGSLAVDRLMLTGPGKTKMEFLEEGDLPEGVFDLESFWSAIKQKTFVGEGRIAIVGAGENAASALLALAQYSPSLRVDVITPKGFIATRAENFYENQFYSQPERNGWTGLELADRKEFVERTDLGVFSSHAMSILNDQIQHRLVPGRLVGLKRGSKALSVQLVYGQNVSLKEYDQVILATGFDQVKVLTSILTTRALKHIERSTGTALQANSLSPLIDTDLSVQGLQPALHLPMLAGLMQGPGFANLSCLGRLSDRIVAYPLIEQGRRAEAQA